MSSVRYQGSRSFYNSCPAGGSPETKLVPLGVLRSSAQDLSVRRKRRGVHTPPANHARDGSPLVSRFVAFHLKFRKWLGPSA